MIKQRVQWVDSIKCIAIVCIMGNHLSFMNDKLYAVISPIYLMPFFFCSGYTYKQKLGFKDFLAAKARQLLIPWLVLSVFNILLAQVFSFNSHKSLGEELLWNFLQIRGKDDGMWFVAALFVAYIPFYFFVRWYRGRQITPKRTAAFLLLAFVLSVGSMLYMQLTDPAAFPWGSPALPWHLEYMFQAMLFMALGYVFREKWEAWFDAHNSVAVLVAAAVAYLLVTSGAFQWLQPDGLKPLAIPLAYARQLLGVYVLVSLCKKIKPGRYMQFVGQNTLLYFGLHGKLCSLIAAGIAGMLPGVYARLMGDALYSSVAVIVSALFMSVVLIGPIWMINRYVPFVAGKRK